MVQPKKAVYFFCTGSADSVAGPVLDELRREYPLEETALSLDGNPVLEYRDQDGNTFSFVRTGRVVSHDYTAYLPLMTGHFADRDLAGIITWHEGHNAPDGILTAHTTGDVDSGSFGPADPESMRNLLLAMEKFRLEENLTEFRVITEATHWSGMVCSECTPDMIPRYSVPLLDIEIGSSPPFWENRGAARVLARSLLSVFRGDGRKVQNILCAGGVHFEPAFSQAVFTIWDNCAYGVSHILANQWLVTGKYGDDSAREKLEACVRSIRGGISAIAFHDNLKGLYKDSLRALGAKYGLPVFKHQGLRKPENIPWPEETAGRSEN